MKTFTRMIGRYVLATAAVVLLVVGLLLGAVVYLGLHYGAATDSRVRIGTLAEALTPTADGLQLDPARTPADWLQGYAWAMALDDDGSGHAARAGAAAGCGSRMLSAVQLARCAALADDCRRAGHRSRWRYDPAADRRLCGGAGRHGQPHE